MADVHADAPGRVNLIGEHTDYHEGFVMPCAVPQRTHVVLTPRDGRRVRLFSEALPGRLEYVVGHERRLDSWCDYVQGITWTLARRGLAITGFDLHVRSDVPVGSGLSSSAALEISTLRALRIAFSLDLSDVELAQIAQRAEVEFVAAPVGIMDQMAASLAGEREALFLDTRTLACERLTLPAALELVVLDSRVPHQHAGGDYALRRRESEEAARALGVERLRDAPPDAWQGLASLPPLLARRARHVITENDRVLRAREALLAADLDAFGRLIDASHASLRDDYEVSIAAVDHLVALAGQLPAVFGARMTGGGFGGAIVIAVRSGHGAGVARAVVDRYREDTGREATVLVPRER